MPNLTYQPSRVSHPGATLQDLLDERGMSQKLLSIKLGRSDKNLNQVVKGKAPITPDLALDLERVLGTPAKFWLEREATYQEWLCRSNVRPPSPEDLEWAKAFPYEAMTRNGWVPEAADTADKFNNLLRFFGVANRSAYDKWLRSFSSQMLSRQGSTGLDPAVIAWLRQGERQAESIDVREPQQRIVKESAKIPGYSLAGSAAEIVSNWADHGIALVFVPTLPGLTITSASRWLSPSKAMIQASSQLMDHPSLAQAMADPLNHILKGSKRKTYLGHHR